ETAIVNLAIEEPDLSPRELAVNFTDTKGSFVSEATVYRLLKDHGLITGPAFILMKAADRFANPTTAPNQLWQTDFTYLKVIGWCMSSEHFGQSALPFKRMSGSSRVTVQAGIGC